MPYETLLYGVEEQVATITLNRPEALNTIVPPMPDESRPRSPACPTEGERWASGGEVVLRGRQLPTELARPAEQAAAR